MKVDLHFSYLSLNICIFVYTFWNIHILKAFLIKITHSYGYTFSSIGLAHLSPYSISVYTFELQIASHISIKVNIWVKQHSSLYLGLGYVN